MAASEPPVPASAASHARAAAPTDRPPSLVPSRAPDPTPAGRLRTAEALLDAYPILNSEERLEGFAMLGANEAADFFLALSARAQAELLRELGPEPSRPWMRLLAPDDAADVLAGAPGREREPASWPARSRTSAR